MAATERRGPRPPQEHRQIGDEQRDDRAREAVVRIAASAQEDLLVADLMDRVGGGKVAVHLDLAFDALPRAAVGEQHDRA